MKIGLDLRGCTKVSVLYISVCVAPERGNRTLGLTCKPSRARLHDFDL